MSGIINGPVNKVLANALDSAWLNQRVIANNVANVNTPNFKRSEVSFQDKLQAIVAGHKQAGLKLSTTSPKHISGYPASSVEEVQAEVYRVGNTSLRADGNNVDMDIEMAKLAKVQLLYNTLMEVIAAQHRKVRVAITEGR